MAEISDGPAATRASAASPPPNASSPTATASTRSIRLTRGTRVSLRRQLAAQLAAFLRAGRWTRGDRLPGARSLGRRLGLDRKTVDAAYRELAGRGLVEIRPGAGVYAAAGRASGAGSGRDRPGLRGFLARQRASGRSAGELAAELARWRETVAAGRAVVAGSDLDLLAVWTAEAREVLGPAGLSVEPAGPGRLEPGSPPLTASLVLAGPASRRAADALASPGTEVTGLRPGIPTGARRLLARCPSGTVVAAVSRSRRLRAELVAMAAALRGGDVAVAGVSPDDGPRLRRRLRVARFVLVDLPGRPALEERVPADRLVTLRHLAPDELEAAARWLGR